jgi:hypothetical protein
VAVRTIGAVSRVSGAGAMSRNGLGLIAVLAALVSLVLVAVPAARAADWMQVSCVNPDGSVATSQGWAASVTNIGYGSSAGAVCGPGAPMTADLSGAAPESVGSETRLVYTPPAGSTLVGGALNVDLFGDGGGTNASGDVVTYEPAEAYPSDVQLQCAEGLGACSADGHDYHGVWNLPANLGGTLTVAAACGGAAGYACTNPGPDGSYALAEVDSADLLLQNTSAPGGSGFSGTVLRKTVTGTGNLLFTATDPDGPGVYSVTVTLDGTAVYQGTPDNDNGSCVAVGTDPGTGALMFDTQQPCKQTETIEIPVPTAGLPDGSHELAVSVTDAAGNSSPVFDQDITTSNPVLTPSPSRKGGEGVKTRFLVSWGWNGPVTHLRSIRVHRLPRNGRLTVSCEGAHCPHLKLHSVSARHVKRLLKELRGRRLLAGDRLLLTVTQPHHRAERIAISVQTGAQPIATLLSAPHQRKHTGHKRHKKR